MQSANIFSPDRVLKIYLNPAIKDGGLRFALDSMSLFGKGHFSEKQTRRDYEYSNRYASVFTENDNPKFKAMPVINLFNALNADPLACDYKKCSEIYGLIPGAAIFILDKIWGTEDYNKVVSVLYDNVNTETLSSVKPHFCGESFFDLWETGIQDSIHPGKVLRSLASVILKCIDDEESFEFKPAEKLPEAPTSADILNYIIYLMAPENYASQMEEVKKYCMASFFDFLSIVKGPYFSLKRNCDNVALANKSVGDLLCCLSIYCHSLPFEKAQVFDILKAGSENEPDKERILEKFKNVTKSPISDPYLLSFIELLLVITKDPISRLKGIFGYALWQTGIQLPWNCPETINCRRKADEFVDFGNCESVEIDTSFDAQSSLSLQNKVTEDTFDEILYGLSGNKDNDYLPDKYNLSQEIFQKTGVVPLRQRFFLNERFTDPKYVAKSPSGEIISGSLLDAAMKTKTESFVAEKKLSIYDIYCLASFPCKEESDYIINLQNKIESNLKKSESEKKELQKEIERQKKEIESLKAVNIKRYEEIEKLRNEKISFVPKAELLLAEQEIKALCKENEELGNKLSEVSDDLDACEKLLDEMSSSGEPSGDENAEAVKEPDIAFPFHTTRRIVVFGGFPTFLQKLKRLLPDVTIVLPTELPNENMLRNTDVAWLQINCCSHSFYNRAKQLAKNNDVPVLHLNSASSEKCAREIAEYERKIAEKHD